MKQKKEEKPLCRDKEPCLNCTRVKTCDPDIACLVFNHWSDTGRTLPNIFQILNKA
jgi:hypothetical protein